jgi:hypothetical protein
MEAQKRSKRTWLWFQPLHLKRDFLVSNSAALRWWVKWYRYASLSGAVEAAADTGAATAVVRCRLFQRGDGWETRQERSLCAAEAAPAAPAAATHKSSSGPAATCPFPTGRAAATPRGDHGKGEGGNAAENAPAARLRERNVLVRPGKEDVVVDRFFTKVASPPPN